MLSGVHSPDHWLLVEWAMAERDFWSPVWETVRRVLWVPEQLSPFPVFLMPSHNSTRRGGHRYSGSVFKKWLSIFSLGQWFPLNHDFSSYRDSHNPLLEFLSL